MSNGPWERMIELADRTGRPLEIRERIVELRSLLGPELEALESELRGLCEGYTGLAADCAKHLIGAGGKRVRPLFAMLSAGVAGGAGAVPRARPIALAVELVHNGTLMHDDVVDDGTMRRGKPAARVLWGNAVSVLSGDFMLLSGLEEIIGLGRMDLVGDAISVIRKLVSGEVEQLARRGKPLGEVGLDAYLRVIDAKTAELFAWCMRNGARVAGGTEDLCRTLSDFGLHVGRAFQIVDDILDFSAEEKELGKDLFADLREGKVTLPLLEAVRGDPSLADKVDELIRLGAGGDPHAGLDALARELGTSIRASTALEQARDRALKETEDALSALCGLSASGYPGVIRALARALVARAA